MDEYTRKKVKVLLGIVATLVCLALVIIGHSMGFMSSMTQGIIGLGVQLIGLAGILFLLYGYFRAVEKPKVSLLLTIISLGTRVVLAYAFAPVFGVGAIWWAIPIGWVLADVTGTVLIRTVGTGSRLGSQI